MNASGASITGAGFSAVGNSATSFSLPAGQSVTVQIQFAPKSPGAVTGSASISSDASNSPLTVSLSGTGTQGQLSAIPSTASFGSVAIGSNNSQSIQLSNGGNTDVTISQASVSGNGFSMTGLSASQVIAAGKSAIFSVSFAPTAAGNFTGSVSIASNAANTPFLIALSGSAVAPTTAITVSPASLSFGNQNVNTTSGPGVVAVTNTGNTSVTVSSVQTSAPFAVSGFSGSTVLSANQSLSLNVTFAPTSTVTSNGTLTITSTAPSSPNTVSLSGTGVVQSGLDLTAPNCGISSTSQIVPSASAYRNFVPPAVGGTYTDPGGYCTVKRITGTGGQMIPFYSLVQAVSAGDTKLLLYDGDNAHWNIYDFNGKVVVSGAAFDAASNDNSSEPRWDRFNDNVIWITTGNSIEKCTITMGTPGSISCAITHTFSEYAYTVNFPGDSDMNANGWVPMSGQNVRGTGTVDIFMFQPNTNTKAGTFTTTCTGEGDSMQPGSGCVHRLIATPNNGMTIEGANLGSGQYLWLPPFSGAPIQWNPTADHHSVGYNIDGTTLVGAFEDFDYNTTGGICNYKPTVIFFTNTSPPYGNNCPLQPTSATPFGWHVSYMDHATRPWIAWTMMGNGNAPEYFNNESSYADPSSGNWPVYQGEVILTRVDSNVTSFGQATTTIFRLALHHARQHNSSGYYWQDVYAPISWDGKYVVFSSNAAYNPSGCPTGGVTGDCGDTYLIGPLF